MTRETTTSAVLRVLREADDYLTAEQVGERLHGGAVEYAERRRISAALRSLLRYHVVDFVEGEAALWWFALPPEEDRRTRTQHHITEHITRTRRPGLPHPRSRVPRRG